MSGLELHRTPFTPFMNPRTASPPGMGPLDDAEWLVRDEAFAAQMAYRDRLFDGSRDAVLAGEGCDGAAELLDHALAHFDGGYDVGTDAVLRPDGVSVPLDRTRPLLTLGRLAQEDFCLLAKAGDEHVLIGAALCFPSRWSLAEKMGRPLIAIHEHVPAYDDRLAPRVQRFFDAVKPERPLVRGNWMIHSTPELYQPKAKRFAAGAKIQDDTGRFWLRVERQCVLKLDLSGVAVFSIKTAVTPIEALGAAEREGLLAAMDAQGDAMRGYHGGEAHYRKARAAIEAAGD